MHRCCKGARPDFCGCSGLKCTFIHGESFAVPEAKQDTDSRLSVFQQLRRGTRGLTEALCETVVPQSAAGDFDSSHELAWLGEVLPEAECCSSATGGSCARLPFFVRLADIKAEPCVPCVFNADDDCSFASTRSLRSDCQWSVCSSGSSLGCSECSDGSDGGLSE